MAEESILYKEEEKEKTLTIRKDNMGFLSKLKHHAKKLIGKQVDSPEKVAEKVTDHVEKVEKKVKKSVRKTKNKAKGLIKKVKKK